MPKYNPCPLCGKKAKRKCPALKKNICSFCCASKRNDSIECSPECEHNLFGITNYQRWLDFETKWDTLFTDSIIELEKDKFMESFNICKSDNIEENMVMNATTTLLLYYMRDEFGKANVDYLADKFSHNIRNDEKLLVRYMRDIQPAIIEIQKKIDHKSVECIDILDPERGKFILFDNSVAKVTNRFDKILTWIFHLPHFSRVSGFILILPPESYDDFINTITKVAEENNESIVHSIAMNYGKIIDLLYEVGRIQRQKIKNSFRNMDVKECKTTYSFSCPFEQIEDILDTKPEIEFEDIEPEDDDPPTTQNYVWLIEDETKKFDEKNKNLAPDFGVSVLADVKLMPGILEIRTTSEERKKFANKMTEKFFGNLITFVKEKIVDIAKQSMDKIDKEIDLPKENPVMKKLNPEQQKMVLTQFYEMRYRAFLDEKVPALDNMTPLEAAGNSSMRLRLIELMKGHVNRVESDAQEKKIDINIDWVLEELGLNELI